MDLKEARKSGNMTQQDAARFLGISLRSYKDYENNPEKSGTIKYEWFLQRLLDKNRVDETHGILSLETIIEKCSNIFQEKSVNYCYLFGSYAKKCPSETSDIDLLISTDISGIAYYSLVEELRKSLKKKIDLLDLKQLDHNPSLLDEILKYGVKIYGI